MNARTSLPAFEMNSLASHLHIRRNAAATLMHVAIVEDDPLQADLLVRWLRESGHQAHHFDRGAAAIGALSHNRYDAMVLAWNLPDVSGVEVLRRIRGNMSSIPVLVASVRDREEDVVRALRCGADDCMIKPIRHHEFIARVEAVARRGKHCIEQEKPLKLDGYIVDGVSRTLTRDGHPVDLTRKDFDLSVLFLSNVGKLLSRNQISERVWGRSTVITSRTLDTHVSRVRGKLGFTPESGWCLTAKYGHGYRLERLTETQQVHQQTTAYAAVGDRLRASNVMEIDQI
jgi:two-component system response regulator RegX3